jgi:hypothetical protein
MMRGMTKKKHVSSEALDASLVPKQRKSIPHAFVLDAISTLSPRANHSSRHDFLLMRTKNFENLTVLCRIHWTSITYPVSLCVLRPVSAQKINPGYRFRLRFSG